MAELQEQELSTGELLRNLSERTSRLVHQEVELAKAEVTAKAREAATGSAMLGGAAVVALFALGALTTAAIAALSLAIATWLAALIVAAVWALVAGTLAASGRRHLRRGLPPVPEESVESVKEDVRWTKERAQAGHR